MPEAKRRVASIAIAIATLSSFMAGVLILSDEGQAYTSHTPIRINCDSDFQIGSNGVVAGDGSAGNPYLISAWDIDAGSSVGVYIGNTTAHFRIANMNLHTADTWPFFAGIHLKNVVNGQVTSSVLSGNLSYGVYMEQSSSIQITQNNMSGKYMDAVFADTVNGLTVSENDFYQSYGSGVTAKYSNNTVVSRNDYVRTSDAVYALVCTNCTIHANQIQGLGSSALWVAGSRNASITYNNITNEFRGIFSSGTSYDILVKGNTLTDIDYPILSQNVARLTIRDNLIDDSDNAGDWGSYGSYGIYVGMTTDMRIWSNTMLHCGITIWGQALRDYNTHVISQNNTVNGKPVLYYRDQTDIVVDGQDVGEIILANCSRATCSNLQISDSDVGMVVAYSNGVVVQSCNMSNNSYAQVLMRADRNVNLSCSQFCGGFYGVLLLDYYAASSNISLYGSSILGSAYNGLQLSYVTQTSIMHSKLAGSGWYGAWLESCNWGNITLSEFSNNSIGLYLRTSMYFKVWHNNFINNTVQAMDDYANTWDDGYPSGGNYWDNFTVSDDYQGALQLIPGSDQIGDDPFWIDPNSLDQYPLMQPIPEFGDLIVPIVLMIGIMTLVRVRRRRADRR